MLIVHDVHTGTETTDLTHWIPLLNPKLDETSYSSQGQLLS